MHPSFPLTDEGTNGPKAITALPSSTSNHLVHTASQCSRKVVYSSISSANKTTSSLPFPSPIYAPFYWAVICVTMDPLTASPTGAAGPLLHVITPDTAIDNGFTFYNTIYHSLFWPWQITKAVTTWTVSASWTLTSFFIISPAKAIFNWITAPFTFVTTIFLELKPLLIFLLYAVAIGLAAGAIIAITTELIMALASAVTPDRAGKPPLSPKPMEGAHKLAITPGSASRSSSLSFDTDDDPWAGTSVSPKTQFLIPALTSSIKQRPQRHLQGLLTETIHEESSITSAHSSASPA
ncbi:hypothetical protein QBC40DRAFT_16981 [Triangularia verruculosa]|uniref:Uncharacterized protein n=1 Tax=Triangularia verruculosa TaxID=2587418 RepID=A0AAN7AWA9_9PEZI|nr:hypothetical protein QBC40DRAFT_16981 [Triangularia verruculosa]